MSKNILPILFLHLLFWQSGRDPMSIKKRAKIFVAGELEISPYTEQEGKKQMSLVESVGLYRIAFCLTIARYYIREFSQNEDLPTEEKCE